MQQATESDGNGALTRAKLQFHNYPSRFEQAHADGAWGATQCKELIFSIGGWRGDGGDVWGHDSEAAADGAMPTSHQRM